MTFSLPSLLRFLLFEQRLYQCIGVRNIRQLAASMFLLSPLITNLKSLKREILCVDVLRYLIKKSSFLQKGLRYVSHFKTSRCLIGDETRSFRNLQQNRLITVLILFSIGNGKCHWINSKTIGIVF